MSVNFTSALIDRIIKGRCPDFAAVMGMRKIRGGELQVNAFLPGATAVEVLQRNGKKVLGTLTLLHAEGVFSGAIAGRKSVPYKLRVYYGTTPVLQDDPYRFPSRLDKAEMQLFALGQHDAAWQLLGAHRCSSDDVDGVQFVLWAPAALRVSLLCEQNSWDGRCLVLRQHAAFGLWELFVPGVTAAALGGGGGYSFEVLTADHRCLRLPFDPFARQVSVPPDWRSCVAPANAYQWQDQFWQQVARDFRGRGTAISIREIAITFNTDGQSPNWHQLAPLLLEQVRSDGFTHVLLTARSARVGDEQQVMYGLLAPDPALGPPDGLRMFVDQAHQQELGVLWDVSLLVVLHTLSAGEQLSSLLQPEILGGPLLSILPGYFSYWRDNFHIDGFCVRDVDTLLQLPAIPASPQTRTKRKREATATSNPFVKEWLSQALQRVRTLHPELLMIVETAGNQVFTQPVHSGGVGFDYRISAGDDGAHELADMQTSIRGLLSRLQDGNRDQSLLSLPWQQLTCVAPADVALLMLACWTLPGRKHLQLDGVWRQGQPLTSDAAQDWQLHLAARWPAHDGSLLRELNQLYQSNPCLYEVDASHEGMAVVLDDEYVFAYERKGRQPDEVLLMVLNAGASATDVELRPRNAGEYWLRYHTPCSEEQGHQLPKLVRSAPCSASSSGGNPRQKLALMIPGRSGVVYLWRG